MNNDLTNLSDLQPTNQIILVNQIEQDQSCLPASSSSNELTTLETVQFGGSTGIDNDVNELMNGVLNQLSVADPQNNNDNNNSVLNIEGMMGIDDSDENQLVLSQATEAELTRIVNSEPLIQNENSSLQQEITITNTIPPTQPTPTVTTPVASNNPIGSIKRNVAVKKTALPGFQKLVSATGSTSSISITHLSASQNNSNSNGTSATNTSSSSSINIKVNARNKPIQRSRYNEDEEFMDDNSLDYDSNDDYMPPKNTREDSDDSDTGTNDNNLIKRKSSRLTKKPKILEEFLVESSSDSMSQTSRSIFSNSTTTTTRPNSFNTNISSNLSSQNRVNESQHLSAAVLNAAPKQSARKSTAPLMASNLNQMNINKQLIKPSITQTTSSGSNSSNSFLTSISSNKLGPPIKQIQQLNGSLNPSQPNIITQNKPISTTNSISTNTASLSTASSTNNLLQNQNSSTPIVKQYKNKIISCKPLYQTKSTECYPIVKDASTQIDLDEIKLAHTVVPVPVPLNVPVPMCMYQAPMPIPLLIPVPVPVPVFIPTTKRTYDRLERRIKKLRKKLPSDPYEFEILLYAEKLAREEGIPGFEDSSDGESDPEPMDVSVCKRKSKTTSLSEAQLYLNQDKDVQGSTSQFQLLQPNEQDNNGMLFQQQPQQMLPLQNEQTEGSFKWIYGVRVFNNWLATKVDQLKVISTMPMSTARIPDDLLKLKNEELNLLLADYLNEVRKPTGEIYAPESLYYLCLGIQYYLQDKGRVENIFLDYGLFDTFQEALNDVTLRYHIRLNEEGLIVSRIEEEILWECKQLGAHSPFVLLNTILYFNTKYFFLDKPESHKKLSFSNVKKHSKRNIGPNGEDYGKSVFLRYYPDFHGVEQLIFEQGENYDNPLRCPVELYNFYLSKCPESVKNRNDVFYLLPEKASLPTSPVWFSSQPLSDKMLERMLNRIKMVKEVNELLIAASPATSSTIIS